MRHARRAGVAIALAVLGGCAGRGGATAPVDSAAAQAAPPVHDPRDWRIVATAADRQRLREWRTAWTAALRMARGGGAGRSIDADAPLYAFDTALRDPVPPAGDYRCRTVKLGSKGADELQYVDYPFFRCRIATADGVVRLTKLTGSQRLVGTIYAHDATRAVFLGTIALGDEQGAMRYGRDATRDVAGWVERIGPARWRVAQPYPAFESTLDVLDLVPA